MIWLFAVLCVLALVMVRSFHALASVLVSVGWLAIAMAALSVVYKPVFPHILWVLCGTVSLIAVATAFAGAWHRFGARAIVSSRTGVIAAGALATLGCVVLWQIVEDAGKRPRRRRIARAPGARSCDLAGQRQERR